MKCDVSLNILYSLNVKRGRSFNSTKKNKYIYIYIYTRLIYIFLYNVFYIYIFWLETPKEKKTFGSLREDTRAIGLVKLILRTCDECV